VKIVIVYDNERFEDLGISGSVGSLPARILNSIFGINSTGLFDELGDVPSKDVIFGKKTIDTSKIVSNNEIKTSNSHTLNLSDTTPQVQTPGGTAVLGSVPYFPILKGLSVFLLNLKPKGIVEPHTHPNAGELNYVIEGKVRFTVYGPNKDMETSEIGKGQVFFVPAGYFHYLENSNDVNSGTVASFFGNENPEFIGLVGGLSSYSDEILGAVFNTDKKFFSTLPRLVKNVLIAPGLD
jgi:oxalate decarboxylase